MTKKDLSKMLVRKCGLTNTKAKYIINLVFSELADAVKREDLIQLYGFARIEVYEAKPSSGVNFHTGKRIKIDAKKRVRAVFSEEIRKALEGRK